MIIFGKAKKSKEKQADEKSRVHIFVRGRVQGVFYRENTRQKAEQLGLSGWVRNLADGRVEAVFEGEKNKLEEIINWAKNGPTLAQVEKLDVIWEKYKGEFQGFEIRYD